MKNLSKKATMALAITSIFQIAVAQNVAETLLNPVIVTANRTEQTQQETLAATTVITRAQIEQQQAQSVLDVLRGLPGVTLTNSGGTGKITNIGLRGAASNQTLILINGIKTNTVSSGQAALQDIPVELIERIEILRGPASALYGADAIGGVIQIFTKQKKTTSSLPSISLGAGSFGTYQIASHISVGNEEQWLNAALTHKKTDGFNACKNALGCGANEPDRDGYKNLSGSLNAGLRINAQNKIDINWLRAQAQNDYDGYNNRSDIIQQIIGARWQAKPNSTWQSTVAINNARDKSDNFKNQLNTGYYNNGRQAINWQNDFSLTETQLLSLGLDWQKDELDSNPKYVKISRINKGAFIQHQWGNDTWSSKMVVRHDDNEQFGSHNTGQIALGYQLTSQLRAMGSFGTAFRAPTFDALYYPGFSNPNLMPETSKSYELGLDYFGNEAIWGLRVYQNEIKDLLTWNGKTTVNLDKARILGLEANLSTQMMGWDLKTSLTLQDPEDRSVANFGKQLPRRVQQSLRIDLDRSFGAYQLGATWNAEAERFDDTANKNRLGGYTTLDLRAEYQLNKDWRIQAKIGNLFNKHYETVYAYSQPERNVFVTLRYQPK